MDLKLLERIQSLADASTDAAQLKKPGDAMQFAQAAMNIAKAVEALVGSGCRLRRLDGGASPEGVPARDLFDRGSVLDDLLEQRNAIEKLALEWGDRWLAENAEYGFTAVRPITFDRSKIAECLYLYGDGKGENEGLSMNRCRAKAGLPPI